MIEQLFDTIMPHSCCSCGQIGEILCENCKYDIISEATTVCPFCLKPANQTGLCKDCRSKTPFEQFWVVGERSEALKTMIDAYKFNSSRAASTKLTDLLDAVLPVLPDDIALVGVPTTPDKVRVRGFDHIGLIVKDLAGRRGLSVASPLESQTQAVLHFLNRTERRKLGPSLFRLVDGPVPPKVLLIDDILTTGTTMLSAAKLLKKAGVEHLYGAVIARQPMK